MRYHLRPIRMATIRKKKKGEREKEKKKKKKRKKRCIDNEVKLEPLCTVDKNVKFVKPLWKTTWWFFKKLNERDLAILLLVIYPEELKAGY